MKFIKQIRREGLLLLILISLIFHGVQFYQNQSLLNKIPHYSNHDFVHSCVEEVANSLEKHPGYWESTGVFEYSNVKNGYKLISYPSDGTMPIMYRHEGQNLKLYKDDIEIPLQCITKESLAIS